MHKVPILDITVLFLIPVCAPFPIICMLPLGEILWTHSDMVHPAQVRMEVNFTAEYRYIGPCIFKITHSIRKIWS